MPSKQGFKARSSQRSQGEAFQAGSSSHAGQSESAWGVSLAPFVLPTHNKAKGCLVEKSSQEPVAQTPPCGVEWGH